MTPQPKSYQGNKIRVYIGSTVLFAGILSSATVIGVLVLLMIPFSFDLRYRVTALWCRFAIWLAKVCCGVEYTVEGAENLNLPEPGIILSKHQSAWETLAYRQIFPKQTVLLKESLLRLPIWGWALATLKPIAINRKNQKAALRKLLRDGTAALNDGLWVIVFPEGTRTAPGETKKFNAGGAMLAHKTGRPVIPVAHNSGECWSRYSFLKYPGTIQVKIGPKIESQGRTAAEINAEAEAWILGAMQTIKNSPSEPNGLGNEPD